VDPTELIPHREPILCIDEVIRVDAEHAVAERLVREGPHTGEDGLQWEGALIEGLAQTAAAMNGHAQRSGDQPPGEGLLVGVRGLVIARRARIGERIRFRVELIKRITPLTLVRGEVTCGDEVIAAGELKFFVGNEP